MSDPVIKNCSEAYLDPPLNSLSPVANNSPKKASPQGWGVSTDYSSLWSCLPPPTSLRKREAGQPQLHQEKGYQKGLGGARAHASKADRKEAARSSTTSSENPMAKPESCQLNWEALQSKLYPGPPQKPPVRNWKYSRRQSGHQSISQ